MKISFPINLHHLVILILVSLNSLFLFNNVNVSAFNNNTDLRGYVDGFDSQRGLIHGWACHINDTKQNFNGVTAFTDEYFDKAGLYTSYSNVERQDVKNVYANCNIKSGFEIDIRGIYGLKPGINTIYVTHSFNKNLTNSPITIDINNQSRPTGYFGSITEDNVINGWACDPDSTPDKIRVIFYVKNPKYDPNFEIDPRSNEVDKYYRKRIQKYKNITIGEITPSLSWPEVNQLTDCKTGNPGFNFEVPKSVDLGDLKYDVPSGEQIFAVITNDITKNGFKLVGTEQPMQYHINKDLFKVKGSFRRELWKP